MLENDSTEPDFAALTVSVLAEVVSIGIDFALVSILESGDAVKVELLSKVSLIGGADLCDISREALVTRVLTDFVLPVRVGSRVNVAAYDEFSAPMSSDSRGGITPSSSQSFSSETAVWYDAVLVCVTEGLSDMKEFLLDEGQLLE